MLTDASRAARAGGGRGRRSWRKLADEVRFQRRGARQRQRILLGQHFHGEVRTAGQQRLPQLPAAELHFFQIQGEAEGNIYHCV